MYPGRMKAAERLLWAILCAVLLGVGLSWPRRGLEVLPILPNGQASMVIDGREAFLVVVNDGVSTAKRIYPADFNY